MVGSNRPGAPTEPPGGPSPQPSADGPGVPRGRLIPEGDGGGPRALSQDGTKPIGGRKNHPGSPPSGAS